MNSDARTVFLEYFGAPEALQIVLLGGLALCLGIVMLVVLIKTWNDRNNTKKDVDDTDVLIVMARALALMFITVALFKIV